MVSRILGPDGQPVSSADFNTEIAFPTEIGVRAVNREAIGGAFSPESMAEMLRSAANGQARRYLTLAEEMEERYLHYASQLQTRRLAVEAIEPSVVAPDGTATKIIDAVHGLVETPEFRELVGEMQDGIGKGYAAHEILWDYRDGLLKPVKFIWRDQRYFQFDRISLTELRLAVDNDFDGIPLQPFKFVAHMPRSKMGIPLRRGVARAAAWAYMLQSFSLKDWAAFSEVYGMPIRVGRYPANSSKDDVRTLLAAVRGIASDAAAVIPIGMELEFVKVEGSHGTAVFGGLLDYVDKNVSKLVVGQTMTSDEGGSLAQAKVHNEVRLDIVQADGRQTGNTLTRAIIEPFVAFNFGPQPSYPRVVLLVSQPDDIVALSGALNTLVPLGLKVSASEVREKLGLSEPEAQDELLAAPKPDPAAPPSAGAKPPKPSAKELLAAPVRGCQCGGCLTRLAADPTDTAPDGIDLTDALLDEAMGGYREIIDPLLGPLLSAARNAKTFDEAIAAIRRRGPDGEQLLERLAAATAKARAIGDTVD